MGRQKVFMRQMVGLTLIAFIMLLLSISGTRAASPQYGGVMKVVDMAEGAAPIGAPWENNTIDTKLMGPVIETLYREDPSGKVYPHLATDYKLDLDNKTLTFNLRKGIKFHDGTTSMPKLLDGVTRRGLMLRLPPAGNRWRP